MTVNGIEITKENILSTRLYFVAIHRECIQDAITGKTRVNDLEKYIKWEESLISRMQSGQSDHTLTFIQAALWIQTGECIAILS